MHVVILSRSENIHADLVQKNCEGIASIERINFDFENSSSDHLPKIVLGQDCFQRLPDAFFVHHPRISYNEAWFSDVLERKLFVASWDSVKEWMEAAYPNAKWINKPSACLASRNMLGQLSLAKALEFQVPDTLFTNDAQELKDFAGNSKIVIKQGNLGVHIEKKRILTSLVDVPSITQETLRGCPCLFQRYVEKRFELRVHVIGNEVLTCKIASQASNKTKIDWRNYDLENTPHEKYSLDPIISSMCVSLVQKMNLIFGVIDLVITPNDKCVFLECNAQGHWSWIEKLTGLSITKTLCDNLLSGGSK